MTGHLSQDMQDAIEDDRPIAVRRKRRSSTGLADKPVKASGRRPEELSDHDQHPSKNAKTPTKPKKRVRFSDPGLELSVASTSTSLTPALKRTILVSESRVSSHPPRLLENTPRRRLSLPVGTQTASSLSLSSDTLVSGEIQYAPLRQVLDNRVKRRLRRNNLSEEINQIESERKDNAQWKIEIQELKDQIALERQLFTEIGDSANSEVANERIQALENEISKLKGDMRERSATVEPPSDFDDRSNTSTPPSSLVDASRSDELVMADTTDDIPVPSSDSLPSSQLITDAATQVSLPSSSNIKSFRSARLSLEYLFPGEIPLGLPSDDPQPIMDVMIERLHNLRAQVLLAEDALSNLRAQESSLRANFDASLQQLNRARTHNEELNLCYLNEKGGREELDITVQKLREKVDIAESRAKEMENDVDEKERSIQKLQDALETYRVEVAKLEVLVTTLERGHCTSMSNLRTEMDEAVADLECHVAAETQGRRAAEKEAVERGERIKQLEGLDEELRGAVHEKQRIIREMESQISQAKEGREKEIGGLNVKIGQLTSNLEEAKGELVKVEGERMWLIGKVEEEKVAGTRAVQAVQAEMKTCMDRVDGTVENHVKDAQSRGAEVAEHKGLLTPVSACRFKDVEGFVEIKRGKGKGKRKWDSGIGVRDEEDEDEDDDILLEDA
ncbi:hypothetical protein MMC12_001950 [Toensbergia leucococca]|nr:hypothetical protein [Toensbergia leucococca]